ncbi:MAG: RNA polymerase sigma factor [Chlorobi bacterium]|nr:RNA polymerase sigma factor [Chlorobiota bacterium]
MQIKADNNIEKARKGDREAFGKLVKEHQQYAFNLAFRIACNEEDARDIVQESFIKIWKNMRLFEPNMKFTTWMYKIVSNTAIDFLRSAKRAIKVDIDGFHEKLEQINFEHPETQLNNKETGQLIRLISETLSEKQKLVFVLRDLEGLKPNEVGAILDLPETSIKSNLYHARKAIKEKLLEIFSYERIMTARRHTGE